MPTRHGICLVSVPKSGTMFLSRYLEKAAGSPLVFGFQGATAAGLRRGLDAGWHPEIHAKRAANSPDLDVMTRRFAQMLARNRLLVGRDGRPPIFSDHGLANFLRFLIDPRNEEIQQPRAIVEWAQARNLATVFLYRDIRAVASSLAHFLASGKSFLIGVETLASAADLVTRFYAPVLAEQMRLWLQHAAAQDALCLSYEELMADPARWMQAVCRHGGLPHALEDAAAAPDSYRSWTYRANKTSWSSAFSGEQQAALNALAARGGAA